MDCLVRSGLSHFPPSVGSDEEEEEESTPETKRNEKREMR